MGRIENGELLRVAGNNGLEVFVTGDRSLVYEQNLAGRQLAIVVLSTNNWPIIKHYVPQILAVIDHAVPGSFQTVECGAFSRKKPDVYQNMATLLGNRCRLLRDRALRAVVRSIEMIELRDILEARERIRDSIYLSPCAHSETFSQLTGNDIYLKLDNLQMTGSFKERGALNRILALTEEEQRRGVIAASAGNHAQAVSYHATRRGIRAVIVMPISTPLVKVTATRGYGAEVVLCGANYDEAYAEAVRRCEAEHLTLLHAFDDDAIIAGQGSLGLEILEQCPGLEAIVAPIGGGGLIGGIACAVKSLNPGIRIVGVEAEMVPSMRAALDCGEPVTLPPGTTIADGIAVRRVGKRTLPLVKRYVDEIVTVEEEDIANAILMLLEREKTLAEGAGATAMAAMLQHKTSLVGKRTAVVICGGNIDVTLLSRIIERGLVKDGRLVRFRIAVPDYPGALQGLTKVIALYRANIVQMTHDRAYFGVHLGDTLLDITLETRGKSHVAELIAGIREAGYEEERVM